MAKSVPANRAARDQYFGLLRSVSLCGDTEREHVFVGRSYGRSCYLLGWQDAPYQAAAAAIGEAVPGVSKRAIYSALQRSIVSLFERAYVREDADPESEAPVLDSLLQGLLGQLGSDMVSAELDRLIGSLGANYRDWSAFVFLKGLELEAEALVLGEVALYPTGRGPLHTVVGEITNSSLAAHVAESVEEHARECRSYCVLSVSGEEQYAADQAIRQAQHVADVLNLCKAEPQDRARLYRDIGLTGLAHEDRCTLTIMCTPQAEEPSENRRFYIVLHAQPSRYHVVASLDVESLAQWGLHVVLNSLSATDELASEPLRRLRNATRWYSRAVTATTPDEKFVGLMTALESLLVADESVTGITQRLADGVSALLGTDFRNRQDIAGEMRELYNIRGRIVHGGRPAPLDRLDSLHVMVRQTIWEFARREMGK